MAILCQQQQENLLSFQVMYQIGIMWPYFKHIGIFSTDFHESSQYHHESPSIGDELIYAVSLILSRQMQGRFLDQATVDYFQIFVFHNSTVFLTSKVYSLKRRQSCKVNPNNKKTYLINSLNDRYEKF